SGDSLIKYRATLQLAQLAFMGEDLKNGRFFIQKAITDLPVDDAKLAKPDVQLKQIQAYLTCASMQLALGRREDAKTCLVEAYSLLGKVPLTPRKDQLEHIFRDVLKKYVRIDMGVDKKTFETI